MIKIAIVGSGFGLYGQLPAFNLITNCKIVAICGKKTERLINYCESIGLKKIYTDWQEMLSNEKIDAIAIAVDPYSQYKIAKKAMEKGINVFAEKPLAVNVSQAKELLELAKKNKITHVIDFIFPEIDLWQKAKQLIAGKALGKLEHISVNWDFLSFDIKNKISSWKTNVSEGGGALSFYFSHVLYYLEYYGGKISDLRGKLSYSNESPNKGETGVDIFFKFKNGANGDAHISCISRDLNRHQLIFKCEKGEIILENKNKIVDNFTLTIHKGDKRDVLKSNDRTLDNEDERVKVVRKIAGKFVEACLYHKQTTPSFVEGLRVQKLIEKIRKESITLTVAIPTYNRSQYLRKVLEQLHKEKNQSFKVIVSDNNSLDDTEIVIKKYQKIMPNLIYNKNKENIGFSGNFLKLYELAKTRYIWFLSDDEEVLTGAIDKILEALKRYRPVVALFNHLQVDVYGRKVEEGVKIDKFNNYRSLIRTGFLSILVIEKRLSLNAVKKIYTNDNIFFQTSLSILLLNDKFKLCEIASPVVYRNTGYKSGEFFKFIITDLWESIFIVNQRFDNSKFITEAKKQVFKALQLYLSQKLGLFKFYGRPSRKTVKRIFRYYGFTSIIILFFPIIYFLTPAFLLKFIYHFQLFRMYGKKDGLEIYKKNLNRVFKFKRTVDFINYT